MKASYICQAPTHRLQDCGYDTPSAIRHTTPLKDTGNQENILMNSTDNGATEPIAGTMALYKRPEAT